MTLSDAKTCPWCGGNKLRLGGHYGTHCSVSCACGARGPEVVRFLRVGATENERVDPAFNAEAIRLWNSRADAKRVALAIIDDCIAEAECERTIEPGVCKAIHRMLVLRKRIESGDVPGTVAK